MSLKWSSTVSSNKKSTSCYKNKFPPGCCWQWRKTKNCGRICWDAICKLNAGTFLCYVRSTYTLPISSNINTDFSTNLIFVFLSPWQGILVQFGFSQKKLFAVTYLGIEPMISYIFDLIFRCFFWCEI